MTLLTLNVLKSSKKEFVDFWSSIYNDPKEADYETLINKHSLNMRDIEDLFNWKNGMSIIVRDNNGDVVKKHEKKSVFLSKAIEELSTINNLRNRMSFEIEEFDSYFKNYPAIWGIFLLHIINPNNYPIFDQHVYRAYKFITKEIIEEIPDSNPRKMKIYKNEYLHFFKEFKEASLENRKFDKALWAYGKFLKSFPFISDCYQ
jgi:hypothetical protein